MQFKIQIQMLVSKFITFNKSISSPLARFEGEIDRKFEELVFSSSKSSKTVIELGGVSRPVLPRSKDYHYVGIDIDGHFEHDEFYDDFFCQSVEDKLPLKADLIFSKYLMEHVKDVRTSYLHQIEALNINGKLIHLYPLGLHPFSLLNKLIGNEKARKLIPIIRKDSENITGYPAYYSMGNSIALERFLYSQRGLEVKLYYHYGAVDYFTFFAPAALLMSLFNAIARTLNLKLFASNVLLVIEKKGQ
jgi:hypothetical protein